MLSYTWAHSHTHTHTLIICTHSRMDNLLTVTRKFAIQVLAETQVRLRWGEGVRWERGKVGEG